MVAPVFVHYCHNLQLPEAIKASVLESPEKPLPVSSSTPAQFAPLQEKLFRQVLQHMNERAVPYAVAGAFALAQHTGISRDTKDLDIFLPAEHVTEALRSLQEEGFHTEILDPIWLAKAHRDQFFVDLITGMSNAVVMVDQSWIDRGIPTQAFGVPVKVLAAEELIASKLFVTRRERFDGADIVHVIFATRGKLDWPRIMDLAGEHWEIVLWTLILYHYVYPAHPDYIPRVLWDDLLERLHDSLARPDKRAPFRGSLIDPNMFAIDVCEWSLENLLEEYRARRQPKLRPVDEPAA